MLADKGTLFEDVLTVGAMKGRGTGNLVQRAMMLIPTGRTLPEMIYVASLACLAWDLRDLTAALTAAAQRLATITALDTGLEIPPITGLAVINQAVEGFDRARRRVKSEPGRIKRWIKAVGNRNADTMRRLGLIRDDWRRREHKDGELLLRAGKDGRKMARNTAIAHLGKRKDAQKTWDDHLAHIARKEAKHEQ